jgi:hypothetical protein
MTCGKCGAVIDECLCPDIDARLREIANDPDGYVVFKWCRLCDRHYARCTCGAPDFYVLGAGKEWPVPKGGYKNAEGGRTIPDLTRR